MEQQPRDNAGRFGEKIGAAPEVGLSLPSEILAEIEQIRERYAGEWHDPWYHTGGDVWRVVTVADPNDPSGQTPVQDQVLVASTVEEIAEKIVQQHNDIQALLSAFDESGYIPEEYRHVADTPNDQPF